jgi:hypothetical protein
MALIAEKTLTKCRLFLRHARDSERTDRESFVALLEAAIVFSRSVTFHLQKELSNHPKFPSWYKTQQDRLAQSPVSRYMLEQRNYVLKEGPLQARRMISLTVIESVTITESVTIRVIRGSPWYRRSPRILWEDASRPIKEQLRQRAERKRALKATGRRRQPAESANAQDEMYFVDAEWSQKPAMDIVSEHLSILADVVAEATREFHDSPR